MRNMRQHVGKVVRSSYSPPNTKRRNYAAFFVFGRRMGDLRDTWHTDSAIEVRSRVEAFAVAKLMWYNMNILPAGIRMIGAIYSWQIES
jgi:hypothetical protein